MKATRRITPLADRLSRKLVTTSTGCWEFTGYRMPNGYGKIGLGSREDGNDLAHRVAWRLANGPIPAGMDICHRCDNPPCCNPAHLFLGTRLDNMSDMSRKGRHWNQRKTHCTRGHEFTPDNTFQKSGGGRGCKTCREEVWQPAHNERRRARREAARAA